MYSWGNSWVSGVARVMTGVMGHETGTKFHIKPPAIRY
jgi:hypothetical protein